MKVNLSNEYTPYEKWSRADFKLAYEEAEDLRKKLLEEVKPLREKAKEYDALMSAYQAMAAHALTLGRAISHLMEKK